VTPGGHTRRRFLATGAATALGAALGGIGHPFAQPAALAHGAPEAGTTQLAVPGPPLHDADYWAFADWLQPAMDRLWSEAETAYTHDVRINPSAPLRSSHSAAAPSRSPAPLPSSPRKAS